jgi:hypothetical protein
MILSRTRSCERFARLVQAVIASSAPLGCATVAHGAANQVSSYYAVAATHTRLTPAGHRPFRQRFAMVRVSLPLDRPRIFESEIGSVEPADHLIATVREANDKSADTLGYELRVRTLALAGDAVLLPTADRSPATRGELSSIATCADLKPDELRCGACASKPGCG